MLAPHKGIETDLIANGKVVEVPGLGSTHFVTHTPPFRVCWAAGKLNQVQSILHTSIWNTYGH